MRIQRMRSGISFTLTDGDRDQLTTLIADRNRPQKHVWRARVSWLAEHSPASPRIIVDMTDFAGCLAPAARQPASTASSWEFANAAAVAPREQGFGALAR